MNPSASRRRADTPSVRHRAETAPLYDRPRQGGQVLPKNSPGLVSDPRNKPTRRVLVVDDVPEIGALYRALFRRVPAVHIMSSFEPKVQAALARLNEERFDLVITDMRMPDGTGDNVIAAVRRLHPPCPVILMTGYEHLSSREGVAACLIKPLDTRLVLRILTDLLSPIPAQKPESGGRLAGSPSPEDLRATGPETLARSLDDAPRSEEPRPTGARAASPPAPPSTDAATMSEKV